MTRMILASIEGEYRRYRALAERALDQLSDEELGVCRGEGDNAVAVVVKHLGGNLRSRFTDFLTSDGEKPWRDREAEFGPPVADRDALLQIWKRGWDCLFAALEGLQDLDLAATVTIRRQPLTVAVALHRSLAHASYHVGQIVHLARALRGVNWTSLSIPPGGSEAYSANPTHERGEDHADTLLRSQDKARPQD
ncbi:MAG: DUF1572 family protein [Planctomycetes bacterium]|nr:DUF1572 family protein [Planctomycetota bacterium]